MFFKKLIISHAWARFSPKFDLEIDFRGYFDHKSATFCNNGHANFYVTKKCVFLKSSICVMSGLELELKLP